MNIKPILKKGLLLLNILVAVALLFSGFASWVDPNDLLFPAFLGLGFLPLLVLNICLIVLWIVIKPKFAILNVFVIVLTWGTTSKHIKFLPEQKVISKDDLSIMSFNVRLFDLYNWGKNKETRDEILTYLSKNKPKIFCFQEFHNTNTPTYFNTLDTIVDMGLATEVHDEYTSIIHDGANQFGIATLSRLPIVNRERIPLDTAVNNAAIFTDVVYQNDTVRIFNIHLASVHLSGMEADINKHIANNDQKGQMNDLRIITTRLSKGFKRRAKQAQVIRSYIQSSPHPVIVCGDINDTPSSFAYATLSEGLNDAFLLKGFGSGTTYIGLYPLLRIDFMLVDPRLSVNGFSTEQVELSDHRPLITHLTFNKSEE